MVRIVWTELAVEDLREIHDYIAADSIRYAAITSHKIYLRIQAAADNPFLGRMVPEFMVKSIRELIEGNFRIIYRIQDKNKIEILRIIHGARSFKRKDLQ